MAFAKRSRHVRGLGRLFTITRVLAKHGLGDLVGRLLRRPPLAQRDTEGEEFLPRDRFPSPARLRLALEELGPSFIKLGQLMSTRADLFPPEYIRELEKLQDRVPAIPYAHVEKVIERELRQPLAAIFAEFQRDCLAAASVAQVHLARLFSGEQVAVKVIRPGIDKKIREDIRLMYSLAQRLEEAFEIGRVIGAVNLVREFERIIFRELDMLIEAGNIERFASQFQGSQEIHIPGVYWDYTTRSILVMEHIDGIKMDQVEAIRAHGIDPKAIALIGLRSFSRQLMEFGFFHADPHPGNTIVLYDGRVSLVDFGITGYLDEETMQHIANLFLGYAEHNYDMVMDALRGAGLISEETMDLQSFRLDLKDMSEPFYGRSLRHISVVDVYDQVMDLVVKYRVRLPRNLLLLFKTFIQTEALGKILGSDASILEVTRPYAQKMLQRSHEAMKLFRNFDREARQLTGYLKTAPRYAHAILRQTAAGRQQFQLLHSGLDPLQGPIEKGANRLTMGLVIAASLIAAALVLNSPEKFADLTVNLFGLKTISITALFGLAGYSIATILGIWLIVSIYRSGKL
jgi:ubiquinone biosynthesis protein